MKTSAAAVAGLLSALLPTQAWPVSGTDEPKVIADYWRTDKENEFIREQLRIQSDGRFRLDRWGCVGRESGTEGTVIGGGDEIILGDADDETPKKWLKVTWGRRKYLISIGQRAAFCAYASADRRPRDWEATRFFLQREDWETPVSARDRPRICGR